jgi:uncharacterized protein DUF3305
VSPATPLARIPVGVVIERRKAKSQWVDHVWRPVAALPGLPAAAPWTVLEEGADAAMIYAGAADICLYRSEAAMYRDNLASGTPLLWIVLRPTEVDPPYELVIVTADPSEGEGYTAAGNDLVDSVPMPEPVRMAIENFIAVHHVEQPFFKRRRDVADPEALARRTPAVRKEHEE